MFSVPSTPPPRPCLSFSRLTPSCFQIRLRTNSASLLSLVSFVKNNNNKRGEAAQACQSKLVACSSSCLRLSSKLEPGGGIRARAAPPPSLLSPLRRPPRHPGRRGHTSPEQPPRVVAEPGGLARLLRRNQVTGDDDDELATCKLPAGCLQRRSPAGRRRRRVASAAVRGCCCWVPSSPSPSQARHKAARRGRGLPADGARSGSRRPGKWLPVAGRPPPALWARLQAAWLLLLLRRRGAGVTCTQDCIVLAAESSRERERRTHTQALAAGWHRCVQKSPRKTRAAEPPGDTLRRCMPRRFPTLGSCADPQRELGRQF